MEFKRNIRGKLACIGPIQLLIVNLKHVKVLIQNKYVKNMELLQYNSLKEKGRILTLKKKLLWNPSPRTQMSGN
jgi:hypothetical protein